NARVTWSAECCSAYIYQNFYEPARLQVIETCTEVEGRIVSTRRASDGDFHIGLDPDLKSVLNLANVMHARSELVVEVICDHTPTGSDVKVGCGDFHYARTTPKGGARVRVPCASVTYRDHGRQKILPAS